MRAMVLEEPKRPLVLRELPTPTPGRGEVRIAVSACGVCRTDLHVVDGELEHPKLPLVPGHEIVGRVEALGPEVDGFQIGDRVGVPWVGWTCGACAFCLSGRENLCDRALFTGYQLDGGYAEHVVADARYVFPLPSGYSDEEAAPLLCAGLIGYRSLRMTKDARRVGIYGFGAAAHLVTQVALWQGREIYAFTREGDAEAQDFARELGASWAGASTELPPVELDAAIVFAPVGSLVPAALGAVGKGGTVVCAGIHMSDIPSFPYELLWGERVLRSVANLTREDAREFLELAPRAKVRTTIRTFPLERANDALEALRSGRIRRGAAVLLPTASPSSPGR
ncbi:zinc-dependent alcohol dehydrogenase family protein [Vulgatibacter incomptus]|nr:zinc-dependent alcohol dehydrogenase family protein [Vulgatibacter incomptus]